MSKHFLQYWKPEQVDYNHSIDPILNHTGSEQLYRVQVGDFIWIVTVRQGQLSLVGKMKVGKITNYKEAKKHFGSNVYKATYHAIAQAKTEESLHEVSLMNIADELRFVSSTKRVRLNISNGRVDGKQLQTIRELTPASATLLEALWHGENKKENYLLKHYIQYHNTEAMGYPCDAEDGNYFSIMTNKSVANLVGNKVWLISGEGKPRKYYLCEAFIVDEVGEGDKRSAFKYYASGEGIPFRPPIPLSNLSWFKGFLADYQNFSLGLRDVREERYILELEQLASGIEQEEAFEQKLKVGAGFGNPEINRKVEQAAISFVTDWYNSKGWKVKSVEADRRGYDLLCTKTKRKEHVEVKGVQGQELSFIITSGEIRQARNNTHFFICIVTSALTKNPQMFRYTGAEFVEKFGLAPLAYRASLLL